jgi:hypothetical protein
MGRAISNLAHQLSIIVCLELSRAKKNGHFRYQLDYGEVSERAEGEWSFDGRAVRLTTPPRPKPPSFELVRDERASPGSLALTPRGLALNRYDSVIRFIRVRP